MWHRFVRTICLACAIAAAAAPASAQAPGAPEQKARAEIEAVFTAWLEALNKDDGRAAAAFFAPGAPAINPSGVVRGDSQDYANRIAQQSQLNTRTMALIDEVRMIGSDAAFALGTYTVVRGGNNKRTQLQGNWLQLFELRGGVWKIAASSFTQVGPPKTLGK
jgi:uncharacterized protein (TIGR02246 family)